MHEGQEGEERGEGGRGISSSIKGNFYIFSCYLEVMLGVCLEFCDCLVCVLQQAEFAAYRRTNWTSVCVCVCVCVCVYVLMHMCVGVWVCIHVGEGRGRGGPVCICLHIHLCMSERDRDRRTEKIFLRM